MKKLNILLVNLLIISTGFAQQIRVVSNVGLQFDPDEIRVFTGDTVRFDIEANHNVVEVTESTFDANETTSNGGFELPFGGGDVVLEDEGTFFYVCVPHASQSMKGIIFATSGIRMVAIDPAQDQVTIQNFGNEGVDISNYRLCSEFNYNPNPLSNLTVESGQLDLAPGETVTVSGFPMTDMAADLGLFLPEGGFGSTDALVDFFQWGSAGNGREGVAVEKGIWEEGDFAMGMGPFVYTGDGLETGLAIWETEDIMEDEDADFVATLTGSQEVLPVVTPAGGSVSTILNGDTLIVTGSFSGLQGPVDTSIVGGAHIHTGLAGQNGGISLVLNISLDEDFRGGTFEAADNTFVLDDEQMQSLMNRAFYVNIHTTFSPPGEIRGQILPNSDAYYMANLFGSSEVPSVISNGAGSVMMDLQGDTLTVTGAFMGLDGDYNEDIGSHLHIGLAGTNGGVDIVLNPTLDEDLKGGTYQAADNMFMLSDEQKAILMARNYYVNIHSTLFPAGELRGQVGTIANVRFRSFLAGANEVPSIVSGASGGALVELVDSTIIISGAFAGLESDFNANIAGGAHIHQAYAGQNGGITFELNTALIEENRSGAYNPSENTFELTAENLMALINRQLYFNIHTFDSPSGEIRGQILPEKQYYFQAYLSGTQEATPVLSTGGGAAIAEVLGEEMVLSGAFSNMGSAVNTEIQGGAHIHLAPAGSNGGIVFPLSFEIDSTGTAGVFAADSNTFALNDTLSGGLVSRGFYINIHSLENAPGELRGQLLQEAKAYFAAPLSGSSEPVAINSSGSGAAMVEWKGDQLIVSGSFRNLGAPVDVNIAGGAHVHVGYPGQNGGILFPLTFELSEDSLSGTFMPDSNVYDLGSGTIDTVRRRQTYVNIHTLDVASGEIRGNILPPAMAYLTTSLQGINEVPPISSPAFGALKAEVTGNTLTLSGAFQELVGAFDFDIAGGSHLHLAESGANGGIEVELNASVDSALTSGVYLPDSNQYELTDMQLEALLGGEIYFNLHTTEFPAGELRGQLLPETNFFPSDEAVISMPENGATVNISGVPETDFSASWEPATEPDGNRLTYIWQLSPTIDFSQLLVQANVGDQTTFTTTFGVVDSILTSAGLGEGDTIMVFHRAIASDGSVITPAASSAVTLVKGVVTNLSQDIVDQFTWSMYPSPTVTDLNLRLNSPVGGEGKVIINDLSGKILIDKDLEVRPGEQIYSVGLQNISAGFYTIRVMVEDTHIAVDKFIKQ